MIVIVCLTFLQFNFNTLKEKVPCFHFPDVSFQNAACKKTYWCIFVKSHLMELGELLIIKKAAIGLSHYIWLSASQTIIVVLNG